MSSAQFWIEHLELQSERPDLRSVYSNVVYSCRRCNHARENRPRINLAGHRLLDPSSESWARHFDYDTDELVPRTPDADYTMVAYDVNSPPKVALRRERREAIDEALHVIKDAPELLSRVMSNIDLIPTRGQRDRLDIAEHLHKSLAAARRTLLQLAAIPVDARNDCSCDGNGCELSPAIIATLLDLAFEPGQE